MTDKVQKIREEVERLKEETSIGLSEHENGVEQGRMEIINALSLFLDSLQEEPVSEELEEAANAYAVTVYNNYLDNPKAFENIDADTLNEDAFKAGANWQKQKTLKESEDAIQYVKENHSPSEVSDFQNAMNIAVMKAFDAGKEKMREQMMKDATEVTVKIDTGGYPYIPAIELYDYDEDIPLAKEGDKVKIVLLTMANKKKEMSPEDKLMKAVFGNKSKEQIQEMAGNEHPSDATIMFNNALDLILDLVEADPEKLCDIVDKHNPGWCDKNCKNFNKTCLCKALKHYKNEN